MAKISAQGSTGKVSTAGRVTTGSIGGAASATVVFTLPTAMPDTSYTVAVSVEESNFDLSVRGVVSKTASTVSVRVTNNNAVTARTGTLHVFAIHD